MIRKSAAWHEWVSVFQAIALGLVLTYYAGLAYVVSSRAHSVDFVKFFTSARALTEGESLYRPLRAADLCPEGAGCEIAPDMLHPNLNPPLLSVLLAPLAGFGLSASYLTWTALSLLSGLLACALFWSESRERGADHSGLVWLWLGFLIYFPTYTALELGQVTFVVLLLLVGAWLASRRGHDRLAGLLFGLAVHLKVFVALLPVFFAVQRRWRVLAWSIGTAAAVVLLTLPFVGLRAYGDYAAAIRTVTWYGNSWNASYASFMTRILGGSHNTPLVEAPGVAHGLVLLVSGGTVFWLLWLTRPGRSGPHSLVRFDLGFGLTLTVMLLVSPLGWMYYFPLLMLPAYTAWRLTRGRSMPWVRRGLVLAWGLSAVPMPMVGAAGVNDPLGWFTSNSVYFYALFTLTVVVSLALTRVDSGSDSVPAD